MVIQQKNQKLKTHSRQELLSNSFKQLYQCYWWREAVKNVKTLAVMSAGTVQRTPLELVVKTAPKKLGVEMKAMEW